MRGSDDRNLVFLYIGLAGSCVLLGTGFTFGLLALCANHNIDITQHWWLMAIPAGAALLINVFFIELYQKLTRK
jgi:hypothetical protein